MITLFAKPDPVAQTVSIMQQSSPGFWLVTDSSGRQTIAASAEQWRPGESVAVVGGRIVGRAGKINSPTIYEV